jgi:hypothetical protein
MSRKSEAETAGANYYDSNAKSEISQAEERIMNTMGHLAIMKVSGSTGENGWGASKQKDWIKGFNERKSEMSLTGPDTTQP